MRTIGYLLPFLLASVLLLESAAGPCSPRSLRVKQLASVLLAFALVTAAHREFVKLTVTHEDSALASLAGRPRDLGPREEPKLYVDFANTWTQLKRSWRPRNFYGPGESHVYQLGPEGLVWKRPTDASFWEHPGGLSAAWNLWGRLLVMWHWDNIYNGGVYVYPMKRRGFVENPLLASVHTGRWLLHWPLYLLSLAAPFLLVARWRSGTLPAQARTLIVPAAVFVYFIAVLSIFWMPRYSIPARPVSYVLAAASLSWLIRGGRFPGLGLPARRGDAG